MADTDVGGAAAAQSQMAAAAAAGGDERLSYRGVFQRILTRPEIGAAIAALGIWIFFWAVSVPFGKAGGASSILDVASSPLGIMAVAVAMLMIGGEFDLSAGAATGALGIITILMVREVVGQTGGWGLSLWIALPLSLLAALGLGWFNGTVVNRTSLPSFIVTLASFFILRGAKLGYSKLIVGQQQVGKLDDLQSEELVTEVDGIERIFDVQPPVADLIEANIAEGRDPLDGVLSSAVDAGDRGYGFLNKVFAAEWTRNDHIWDTRDWFYTIGIVGGLALCALAIYEMHFHRRATTNPVGLPVFAGGVVVAILGIWRLHATDSTAGNWIGGAIIGAGMLIGFLGWGLWRYRTRATIDEAVDSMVDAAGDVDSDAGFVAPLVFGLVAGAASIVVAVGLDAENSGKLTDALELAGGIIPTIAVLVGVGTALLARAKDFRLNQRAAAVLFQNPNTVYLANGIIAFLVSMVFLDLVTEQGARAIFFLVLAAATAIGLLIAVGRARRQSQALGSVMLMLTALALLLMAFFIRSESASPKFRTQAFAVMLVIAALMAIWAIASLMFDARTTPDSAADRFGNTLAAIGGGALVIGIASRLLFITNAELEAGIPPAKFSVRIIWFLVFTIACSWVLARTQFGSWTFAVGGNKEAARQVGVPAARTKVQLFMLVSFASWLVGLLLAFRLNNIQANTGDGEEFEYIIAAVVGGTMLTGGYGSTIGAAIGAFIMAMSVQGIPSSRWNSDWRFVFLGAILLLAVIANNFIRTKAEAAR